MNAEQIQVTVQDFFASDFSSQIFTSNLIHSYVFYVLGLIFPVSFKQKTTPE